MAKADKVVSQRDVPSRRAYWATEIDKAIKRYQTFNLNGDIIVTRYLLQRENQTGDIYQDKYNILYSTTETTKPSLYAQTPKVQATKRHQDRENENVTLATMLIETAGQYALEEIDFDEVITNAVEDYLLPGMGCAWVRYTPTIQKNANDNSDPGEVTFDGLDVDYVNRKDFLTGNCRTWKENPFCARRVYYNKKAATGRFGAEKANLLTYSYRASDDNTGRSTKAELGGGDQAIIYEIWDKVNKKVVWYSEDYGPDVLDEIDDPLHLKDFFPCPRPLRAVSSTRAFAPKGFYSEYKAQAEELDNLTARIRYLTKALRVLGVYDGSQEQLQQLLDGAGNKMVGVQNWAAFAQGGGIDGAIQWVPIKDIAAVLTELFRQREICKNEIYEITGFSDIVRGVSKASETLGAQNIKDKWAGGRLRSLQKEVQRFCRDIIRIMTEIITEQFSEESLALYAGFEPPPVTDEEQAAAAQYAQALLQYQSQMTLAPQPGVPPMQPPQKPPPTMRQQAIQKFLEVVKLLKDEKTRCANIGIETDSTIQPDEAQERADRIAFLGQIGAFLQQAGPMALQYPDMRGLLGAIMMFAVNTFRSARPVEQQFEEFQKKLAGQPAMPPPGSEGTKGPDPEVEKAKIAADAQAAAQKQAAEVQRAQMEDATKRYEVDGKLAIERQKVQLETTRIQMDHEYRMRQIEVEKLKLEVERAKLGIAQQNADTTEHAATIDAAVAIADTHRADEDQGHRHEMEIADGDRADEQLEAEQAAQEAAPEPKNII